MASGAGAGGHQQHFVFGSDVQAHHLPDVHIGNYEEDDDGTAKIEGTQEGWVTWLFGAGSSMWPQIRVELLRAFLATFIVIVGAILSSPHVCPPVRCVVLHESISHWLMFVAYCVVISIPGRIFDRVFFAAAQAVGQIVTLSILLPIFFYVSAFEGAISRLWLVSMAWGAQELFLDLRDADAAVFDDIMKSLLAFQLLSIGRQIALRVTLRTVLIGSFEQRIQDVLFQNLTLLMLGQRHQVDSGSGKVVPARRDVPLRELQRMYAATDFRRKLDFVSKARFRLYSKEGEVVPLAKKEAVAPFAKAAFKKLAGLPPEVLVEVERKTEQITAIPDNLRGLFAATVQGQGDNLADGLPAAGGRASRSAAASAGGLPSEGGPGGNAGVVMGEGGGGGGGALWSGGGGGATPDGASSAAFPGNTPFGGEGRAAAAMGGGTGLARSPVLAAAAFPLGGTSSRPGSVRSERSGTRMGLVGDFLDKAKGAVTSAASSMVVGLDLGSLKLRREDSSSGSAPTSNMGSPTAAASAAQAISRSTSQSVGSPALEPHGAFHDVSAGGGGSAAVASATLSNVAGAYPAYVVSRESGHSAGASAAAAPGASSSRAGARALTSSTFTSPGSPAQARPEVEAGRGAGQASGASRGGQPPAAGAGPPPPLALTTNSPPLGPSSSASSDVPPIRDPWAAGGSIHTGRDVERVSSSQPLPLQWASSQQEAVSVPPSGGYYAPGPVPRPASAAQGSAGHARPLSVRFNLNEETGHTFAANGHGLSVVPESPIAVSAQRPRSASGSESIHRSTSLSSPRKEPASSFASACVPSTVTSSSAAGDLSTTAAAHTARTLGRRGSLPSLGKASAAASSLWHVPSPGPGAGLHASDSVLASLNRMLHGTDEGTFRHGDSSVSGAVGRLLRDQLRGVLQQYVPTEELEEVAAATGIAMHPEPHGRPHHHHSDGGRALGDREGAMQFSRTRGGGRGAEGAHSGSSGSGSRRGSAAGRGPGVGSGAASHGGVGGAGTHRDGQPPQGGGTSGGDHASGRKPTKEYPKLRLAHFAACIDPGSGIDVEKAFNLFDTNCDGSVELAEFIQATENVFSELRALKASLSGHQTVSTAMQSLLNVVFWLVLTIVVLLIFDVPVVQVYVPLGTVLVSASFAIGTSLSQIVSSLIFVLVTRPYNVGDRVTASGVFAGEETLIVKKVDVLTTTFLRLTNKEITVPNWNLCGMAIENFKRSPPAVMKIDLAVSFLTTAAQLEALRRRIDEYLASQPLVWKPTCMIRCGGLRDQTILLSVWISSTYLWQDAPRLFRASFMLYMSLVEFLRDCSISFRLADQSLRIEGSIATRLVPGGKGGGEGTEDCIDMQDEAALSDQPHSTVQLRPVPDLASLRRPAPSPESSNVGTSSSVQRRPQASPAAVVPQQPSNPSPLGLPLLPMGTGAATAPALAAAAVTPVTPPLSAAAAAAHVPDAASMMALMQAQMQALNTALAALQAHRAPSH